MTRARILLLLPVVIALVLFGGAWMGQFAAVLWYFIVGCVASFLGGLLIYLLGRGLYKVWRGLRWLWLTNYFFYKNKFGKRSS